VPEQGRNAHAAHAPVLILVLALLLLLWPAAMEAAPAPAAEPYGVFLAGDDVVVGQQSAIAQIPTCDTRKGLWGRDRMKGWGTNCRTTVGQVSPPRLITQLGTFATREEAVQAYCAAVVPGTTKSASVGRLDEKAQFKFDSGYHFIRNAPACGPVEVPESVDVPDWPLVIPAADLEGRFKTELSATRAAVLQALALAKKQRAERAARGGNTETLDTVRFLLNWYTENRGMLESEQIARQAAVEFFELLGPNYAQMTDAERTKVEDGLLARALALRRYRTLQRGIMRAKAGGARSWADLDAYYTAVARANWANLELETAIRISQTSIGNARLGVYGNYDVYELAEARPDPRRAPAIEAMQRRHFQTMVDLGTSAVLGSEIRHEAMLEARKDRLFGLKDVLAGEQKDAKRRETEKEVIGFGTRLGDLTGTLFSIGFGLFDLAVGAGADAMRGGLNVFGADFESRAGKLERQAVENWERAQRRVLALRLLRARTPAEVRPLARQIVARGMDAGSVAAFLGKVDADDIRGLLEDRAFVDTTDGGMHRLLAVVLVDFRERGRIELAIAREKTRLAQRDMEAALRSELGQDPETGEATWGSVLSPTAWADISSKSIFSARDFAQRGGQINLKSAQALAMSRLEAPLLQAGFDFEGLAPAVGLAHMQLWDRSAPYIAFVQRMREERRALVLHAWRRNMPDVIADPAAAALRKFYDEIAESVTQRERRDEQLRMLDLQYEDYIYAWDLSGALSLAGRLQYADDPGFAQTYAARYKALVNAVTVDRVKRANIAAWRNLGDIGFTDALFGALGLTGGGGAAAEAEAGAATAAQGAAKVPTSFARYFYERLNPFAAAKTLNLKTGAVSLERHAVRTVLVQSFTEVLVTDVGVPATGEKYEALLNQSVLALIAGFPRLVEKLSKLNLRPNLEKAVQTETAAYGDRIDPKRYLAELLNRAVVQAIDRLQALGERFGRAREPAARESITRQAREDSRLAVWWMQAQALADRARLVRTSLPALMAEPRTAYEKVQAAYRSLEYVLTPPTIAGYEELVKLRPADLFNPAKAGDIAKLRADFKAMRRWSRQAERPALDRLEAHIDALRQGRFMEAMTEFLSAHGAEVQGVILNGTQLGNPEYKGLFSDKDFTIVTKRGVNEAALRKAANAAFEKQGILLNDPARAPSADIEVMIQDFLPGEIPPIKTWDDFQRWALVLVQNPSRYLSSGGDAWVGLYNYLSGGTLSLSGGRAVIDRTPNRALLAPPDLHPIFAHGLLLDVARYDKLLSLSEIHDANTLADLIGERAKYVLRGAEALIWATYPDLLRARSPEAAQQKGYHQLLVDDVLRLTSEGVLSARDAQLLQVLADVKAGKSVVQALGIEPRQVESRRGLLEDYWRAMDALMQRTLTETRQVYLDHLARFARAADTPARRNLLFVLAFRNWNAARKINDSLHPQKLAYLTRSQNADPVGQMKLEDQQVIALGELFKVPAEPAGGMAILDAHLPRWSSGERPPEGAEPTVRPTALRSAAMPVRQPAPPRSAALAELMVPIPQNAYTRGDGYAYLPGGEKAGFVKTALLTQPYHLVNDVVAFKLGRLLDANIPYTERMRLATGEMVAVMRWIGGRLETGDAVKAALAGRDAAGNPLSAGLSGEALAQRVREDFIRDRLVSAILGTVDRKGLDFGVTRDARLVGLHHERAEPFDARREIASVVEQIQRRFAGESPEPGSSLAHSRQLDQLVGVDYEQVARVWADMKSRIVDRKGALNEKALAGLAAYYGDRGAEVLETWKRRIRGLDAALGRVYLPQERTAALSMDEATFRNDGATGGKAQRQLFQVAKWMRAAQESLVQGLLADLGLPTEAAYAILKRESFEAFRDGVLEKVHRKEYKTVSDMDDMARGRINLPTGADVKRVVAALETQRVFAIHGAVQGPQPREEVALGYPRYHIIVEDPKTGFTFEWQVGTQRTTDFFELEGIQLGKLTLKEGMKSNIHDIEYDIFFYLQKQHRALADELGIPVFRKKVAEYAAKTFEGSTIPETEFRQSLAELHGEASRLLKALIDRTSVEFVQGFFH